MASSGSWEPLLASGQDLHLSLQEVLRRARAKGSHENAPAPREVPEPASCGYAGPQLASGGREARSEESAGHSSRQPRSQSPGHSAAFDGPSGQLPVCEPVQGQPKPPEVFPTGAKLRPESLDPGPPGRRHLRKATRGTPPSKAHRQSCCSGRGTPQNRVEQFWTPTSKPQAQAT